MSIHERPASLLLTISGPQLREELSRTSSRFSETSGLDVGSLPTVDQISTARPSVTMLDKLWTQIDVLDDVKAMAAEIDRTGSFFNDDFAESVAELKKAQSKLLKVMERHQEDSERAREQRQRNAKYASGVASTADDEIQRDREQTKQRMNEFFAAQNTAQPDQEPLRDFDDLNEYVTEVRAKLDEVGQEMATLDLVTKKLW